jgi:hypothetical protein
MKDLGFRDLISGSRVCGLYCKVQGLNFVIYFRVYRG